MVGYRDYVEQQYLDDFDVWVKAADDAGLPDAGNLNPAFGVEAQWDSDRRLDALESHGVVAEVLFPNGQPFQANRLEDFARMQSPELAAAGRRARTTAGSRTSAQRCRDGARARRSCPSPTWTKR